MGSNYANKHKHNNITEFYAAFTNRLHGIIVIITDLMFVGFSNFSFSWYERNVEFINKHNSPTPPPRFPLET